MTTTFQLVSALSDNKYKETEIEEKISSLPPIFKHALTCIFQALRIEVNDEIKALETLLQDSLQIVKKSGRIVILSYHSLEDRLVKNFFRSGHLDGHMEKDYYGNIITPFRLIKCPLSPSISEIEKNPRARSAKIRIAERL